MHACFLRLDLEGVLSVCACVFLVFFLKHDFLLLEGGTMEEDLLAKTGKNLMAVVAKFEFESEELLVEGGSVLVSE